MRSETFVFFVKNEMISYMGVEWNVLALYTQCFTWVILMQGDFSQNLKMLQKYPPVDVHGILHRAAHL